MREARSAHLAAWALAILLLAAWLNSDRARADFAALVAGRVPAAILTAWASSLPTSFGALAVAAAYAALLWVAGRDPFLWLTTRRGGDGMLLEAATGMLAVASAILGLGLVGLLYSSVLAAMALGALAVAARRPPRVSLPRPGRAWLPATLLLPALPPLMVSWTTPPWEGDMLEYHVGLPGLWTTTHRIAEIPGKPFVSFPLLMPRLFVPLVAAGFDHAIPALMFCALILAGWTAGRALAHAGSSAPVVGALLAAGCSTQFGLALVGHPDLLLILSAFTSLLGILRRDFVALGLGCALAAATKYTGWILALGFLAAGWRAGTRPWPAIVICTAANLPWTVRNVLGTGSPVAPFFLSSLHWTSWNSAAFRALAEPLGLPAPWRLPGARWWDAAALFWSRAIHSGWTPYAVAWIAVPPSLLGRRRGPAAAALAAVVLAVVWAVPSPLMPRYLAPATALVYWLAALALESGGRRLAGRTAAAVLLANGLMTLARPEVLEGPTNARSYYAITRAFNAATMGVPGRVLLAGEATGYRIARPWIATDRGCPSPVWLTAGPDPNPERMRVRFRQRAVRWVIHNPVRATDRRELLDSGETTEAWCAALASFWVRHVRVISAPDRFDSSGARWTYALSASPRSHPGPQPWLPGSERLQPDLAALIRARRPPPELAAETRAMGDFGVTWYHRAVATLVLHGDRARAIREGEEALRRGLDIPWLRKLLADACLKSGRPADARRHALRALELLPGDPEAAALLRLSERALRAG